MAANAVLKTICFRAGFAKHTRLAVDGVQPVVPFERQYAYLFVER